MSIIRTNASIAKLDMMMQPKGEFPARAGEGDLLEKLCEQESWALQSYALCLRPIKGAVHIEPHDYEEK